MHISKERKADVKKYILFVSTVLFGLLLLSTVCFADNSDIIYHTDMKPIVERPRVYFTKSDIPEILENAQKTQNIAQWNEFLKFAQNDMPQSLCTATSFSAEAAKYIESKAFYYALYGDKEKGNTAISDLRSVLEENTGVWKDYNTMGEAIYLTGIVYDWCYPLLTDSDMTYFQNKVISLATSSDVGWPPKNGSSVMSHAAEGIFMRDLLCAAIAMYGDNDVIYQNVMGRYFSEHIDARKFMYDSGYFFPGLHYLSYRYQWEIISTKLIDAAYGIPNVYGDNQNDVVYQALYSLRPDGSFLRGGDNAFNNHYVSSRSYMNLRTLLYTASYYDDPYINYEAQKLLPIYDFNQTNANQTVTPVEFLIMSDPDVEEKPVSELPLTRFFSSPYGAMIARTGWDEGIDSPAVVAEMKVVENQFNEHQHLDAGAFQIYYKGGLANDTGYYQAAHYSFEGRDTLNDGNTVYAGAHDNNYMSRTIAHNAMLVYDPSEVFTSKQEGAATEYPIENDGGQARRNNAVAPKNVSDYNKAPQKWRSGRVLGAEFGEDAKNPDWSYLKGDISYAYSDKVSGYERSFMFLNLKNSDVPAAMVVFDRVEASDEDFKKTWLLHTKNEPEITGTRVVAEVTDSGYNGKLTLDSLLPLSDNLDISVISGGEGDAWVNGTNYWADVINGRTNEGGGSRIEISPKTKQKEDFFLNVIQVSDADANTPYEVAPIDTDTHAGAVIADRVVLFAKQKDRTSGEISFSFSSDIECIITVADCKAGSWAIYADYGIYDYATVSESGGVMCFYGYGGSYRLVYQGEADNSVSNAGFDPDSNYVDYIASRTFDGGSSLSVQTAHFTESITSGVLYKASDDNVYSLTSVSATDGNFIHNQNRASADYGYITASSIEAEFMLTQTDSQIGLALCAYNDAGAEKWIYDIISASADGFYINNTNSVDGTYIFDTSEIADGAKKKIADSVSPGKWHKIRVIFSAYEGYVDFYLDDIPCTRVSVSGGSILANGLKIISLTGKGSAIYADNVSYTSAYAMSGSTHFEVVQNSAFEPLYSLSDTFTYYKTSDGRCVITGFKDDDAKSAISRLIIPRDIGGYTVAGIADNALAQCSALSDIVVLSDLDIIGESISDAQNVNVYCTDSAKQKLQSAVDESCGWSYNTSFYIDGDSSKIYSMSNDLIVYAAKYQDEELVGIEVCNLNQFKNYTAKDDNTVKYYLWSENLIPLSQKVSFD